MDLNMVLGLILCFKTATAIRDYYQGVFNKNDLLVAQDTLYKDKAHHSLATASYVRYFKCPISYFRVMDRLGVGRGPRIEKVRGGLKENFILLHLTSAFDTPISVNIHIACANFDFKAGSPIYTRAPWTRGTATAARSGANYTDMETNAEKNSTDDATADAGAETTPESPDTSDRDTGSASSDAEDTPSTP